MKRLWAAAIFSNQNQNKINFLLIIKIDKYWKLRRAENAAPRVIALTDIGIYGYVYTSYPTSVTEASVEFAWRMVFSMRLVKK